MLQAKPSASLSSVQTSQRLQGAPRWTRIKHCCHLSSLTWLTGKRGPFSDFSESSAEGRRYSTDSDSKSGTHVTQTKTKLKRKEKGLLNSCRVSRACAPLTKPPSSGVWMQFLIKRNIFINNFSLMCVPARCFSNKCSFSGCFLGSLPQRPWRQRPRSSPTPLYQSSLDRYAPYACVRTHHHHRYCPYY